MAKISVRNLNDIYRKDSNLGQAMDDLINHISTQKTTIEAQQKLIDALRKKVGV